MSFCVAILLGLAVAAASVLYGGLYEPAFALPSLLLLAVAGGFLASAALSGRFGPRFGAAQVTLLLLGLYLTGRAFAVNPLAGFSMLSGFAALALIYLGGSFLAESQGAKWIGIGLILLAAFTQIGAGIPQALGPEPSWPLPWLSEKLRVWYADRSGGRLHGFYLNANHLAWFLNFSGLFALALALWARIHIGWKSLLALVALVLFWGSFQTLSRGGLLALGAGLLALLLISSGIILFQVGRLRGPFLVMAIGLAIGLFFLLQSGLEQVPEYSVRFSNSENGGDYRQQIWPTAWRQFQTEPVWGTGPDTFRYYGRMYRADLFGTDPLFAHNDWLQFLAEQGMVGLLLLLATLAAHLGDFWRGVRRRASRPEFRDGLPQDTPLAFKIGALIFLVAGTVQSFFDFNLHLPANLFLAALCLGWLAEPTGKRLSHEATHPGWLQPVGSAIAVLILTGILGNFLVSQGLFAIRKLQAENAIQCARLLEALSLSQAAVSLQPESAAAWDLRGQAIRLQEKSVLFPEDRQQTSRTAAKAFGRAGKLEPLEVSHSLDLCEMLLRLGVNPPTWALATWGIVLDPLQSPAYQYAARASERAGNRLAAKHLYSLAVRLPRSGNFPSEQLQRLNEESR